MHQQPRMPVLGPTTVAKSSNRPTLDNTSTATLSRLSVGADNVVAARIRAARLPRPVRVAHVGGATVRSALEKLAGPQRPDVEVETVRFRERLARALAGKAEPPRLELRGADGELTTDE